MIQADRVSAGGGFTTQASQGVEAAQALYRALQAQRDVLYEQLRSAQSIRSRLVGELREQGGLNDAVRTGIEKRIANTDTRIAELEKQIAASEARVAEQAAVPGATYRPPPPPRNGPPEEAFVLAGFLGFIVLLPLTIAYARRIWRRSAKTEVKMPEELSQRMESLERGVEAIALEVERIGESQRFLTNAMADRVEARALSPGQREAERVERR